MARVPGNRNRRRTAALFLAPLGLFLLLMLGYPFVADLVYSLSSVTFRTIRAPTLSGFGNYVSVLHDSAFWQALTFSLRFAIFATLTELLLGLVLAMVLEPLLDRRKGLLAILLLPLMIAPVLMGIMFRLILNEFVGVIPQYLALIGIHISFLVPPYITPTLITIEVVQWTPFAFLILFTALQSIPSELYEAARVDGASRTQVSRFITLPYLVPALSITAFIRFVDSFRVFDHIYVLTGGGPGNLTTSIAIYIYKAFFQQQLPGAAIAASMLLLVLSLGPLLLSMRYVLREGT